MSRLVDITTSFLDGNYTPSQSDTQCKHTLYNLKYTRKHLGFKPEYKEELLVEIEKFQFFEKNFLPVE